MSQVGIKIFQSNKDEVVLPLLFILELKFLFSVQPFC